jgi:hypothetical protein
MAWTVTRFGPIINIVPAAGNTDNFVYSSYFLEEPEGLQIVEIQVVFSAATDKVVIRNGSITGPELLNYTSLAGESMAKLFHEGLLKPCLAHADQTYGTPANWRIIIQTT